MSLDNEKMPKGDVTQIEDQVHPHAHAHHTIDAEDIKGRDFTRAQEELPPGYFTSFKFMGTILAIGLQMACGQGGFSLIAPVLPQINADIGPDPNLTWVALCYLLTTSIGLVFVGRITDIFGRRWWFVGANGIATVGSIVCATAPSVPALIAGQTLIGLGASCQLSYSCKHTLRFDDREMLELT